jgi:tetratricopeptide (TPR) repeat protein
MIQRLRQLIFLLTVASAFTLVTSSLAPESASAAEKKKKKSKKASTKKKASKKGDKKDKEELKKPDEPAKPDATEQTLKRDTAATFKVDTKLDQKDIARTQQADAKRDEAIEELKKLIPKAPETRKAEMIFRLAELYWEKSKYRYGLEMDTYEQKYNDWSNGGQRGDQPEIKDFIRESELIKQNALKLYEKVMTEHPTYERNDEVLFYLGYNEYEAGNKAKAVTHYWSLIKQFPNSKLVPDAYLQLGEHFFNDNNVDKARKAYERALASEVPRVYNYALYKLSWCDYNVQEYAAGIKKLKEVIDKSEKATDTKSVQLKAEALGDLARFFSYVDEVDTAFAYFKKKGGEEIAYRYSTRLGQLFHEQGKWPLEIQTFNMLIEKYPLNDKAPYLQASVVEAYAQMNKKDKVRQEVERLVDLYRPGTPWYKAQQDKGEKGKAALEYAYDLTENKLRDLVTEYHRDAQKRQDVATYQLARDIYHKYLDAFSDTESAYEMRFFFADVLYALKEWKKAAEQYDRVATAKATDGKAQGKYARDAAYNAILSWEKIATEGESGKLSADMKITEKKDKGKSESTRSTKIKIAELEKDKEYKEEPIPEVELKLSQACDLYFKIADRKDSELPAIKFKAAYLYYKYNHFVAAAERYFEIIESWPGDDLAKKSAHLILDSLNVQKKWEELEKYARNFRDNQKLAGNDKKFREEVQGLVEGSAYKSIQVAEERARKLTSEDEKEAALGTIATRFKGFQKEFPKSDYADKAVFSAVLIYNQADELDKAIEIANLMKKEYTKSEYVERNHLLLAEFHERIADFETSAELYTDFTKAYKKSEKVPDALFNAGIYYQGLGKTKEAIERFTDYYSQFENRPDAADVYWRTCGLFETESNWKKAADCYDKFENKYKKASRAKVVESRYRYALMMEKQKQKPAAMKEYKRLVAEYGKLPKKDQEEETSRLAGAHAAFELLDPEYAAYAKMKVTLNKNSLKAKIEKAEDLACVSTDAAKCKKEGKFLSILAYGNGDYGICGLTRMGQTYRGLADSIRGAPLPRNLTEDQIEIYTAELDAIALGPEEKAIGAFENALKKAYELNVYNECTLTAQDNLKQLNPNKFPDLQKREFQGAEGLIIAGIKAGAPAAAKEAPAPAAKPDEKAAEPSEDEEGGDEEEESEEDTGARE